MKSLINALAQLELAAKQQGATAVTDLEMAIADVLAFHDPSCIVPLLMALNDRAEFDEGMFSLIHAAESFDDDVYIQEFLRSAAELQPNSPRWASIVLMRILNNQNTRDILVRQLRAADIETKLAIAWLCEKINEQSASFLSKTLPVILATR